MRTTNVERVVALIRIYINEAIAQEDFSAIKNLIIQLEAL
jgi:hypothetical protein